MKKNKHFIVLISIFILFVLFEYMAPKKPDWTPSFKRYDKIPFGSFILFELLPDIFPACKIEKNDSSLYLKFRNSESTNSSYIIITQEFNPQKVSLESLLSFVERGNKVFIAAEVFGPELCDTLQFGSTMIFNESIGGDSIPFQFVNPHLQPDSTYFIKSFLNYYFNDLDTINCHAIATIDKENVNFFRIKFGQGEFFIHNQPFAFTNYNILKKNNADYIFKVLSYLKNQTIIWDDNYKPGQISSTPLRYILSQKALRAAWYTILGLSLFFVFFSSKRVQRIIPIVVPPENSSLEFAKTLGNLYMNSKNHKDLARKKYNYWLDFLREEYYIIIENPANPDTKKIAEKTGVKLDTINRIIKQKKYIDEYAEIGQDTLLRFNESIEQFHSKRK
jgi:hypothetical protein